MDYVASNTNTYVTCLYMYVYVYVCVYVCAYICLQQHIHSTAMQHQFKARIIRGTTCITSLGPMHVYAYVPATHVSKSARHHCVLRNDKKYHVLDERVSSTFRLNTRTSFFRLLYFRMFRDIKCMKTRICYVSFFLSFL